MDKKYMTAPFAKVNTTEDGGREVWGFSTLERVDKSGEIADFTGTVEEFQKWSDEVSKRSGGKNLGNVRLMHQPIVAGKTVHWEPAEKTIKDEDGNEKVVKGIYVGAYVPPTKPDIIKDIDEHILTGFSIGGSYKKRWWDETTKAFRFIPTLSEYSLVDNPCVEGADIEQVIAKADGPWINQNRNLEKGDNELKQGQNVAELNKRAKLAGSYEELQNNIETAVAQKLKGYASYWDGYVISTMPDKVVVYDYNTRKYLEIPYTNTDGIITVGDSVTEVKEVTTYIPVETQKFIEGELHKRAIKKEKEVEKSMNEEQLKKAAEAAGITLEQFKAVFKAVTAIDEPSEPVKVTTVDGDFDKDDNKEFPNPPEGDQKINIPAGQNSVKEAEKATTEKSVFDELLKTVEDYKNSSNELAKSGKAISSKNEVHLNHAIGHIKAALEGTDYDHMVIDNSGEGTNTGEEAPKVTAKAFTGELQKAVTEELNKSVNKLEALFKGVANADTVNKAFGDVTNTLNKAFDVITKQNERIESMEKMVKEIHETPQPSGVMLNGGSPDMFKMIGQGNNMQSVEDASLEKFVAEIKDPILKDKVSQEIAFRKMKDAMR